MDKVENKYYSKNRAIRKFQERYICGFEKYVKSKLKKEYAKRKMQEK